MSFNIWWTKEKNKIVGQYEEIFILNTFNMLPIAIHMVKSRQEAQKSGQKVQKDKNRSEKTYSRNTIKFLSAMTHWTWEPYNRV